ncbi:hypothetical protein FQN54_008764 [Arachnomyces sp. PD_36]|nr:hypothetical protein FQN54_008764 [Arachnomyces sp. PD_36]
MTMSTTEEDQASEGLAGLSLHEVTVECTLDSTATKASFMSKVEASGAIGDKTCKVPGNEREMSYLDSIHSKVDKLQNALYKLEAETLSLQTKVDKLETENQRLQTDADKLKTENQLLRPFRDELFTTRNRLLAGSTTRAWVEDPYFQMAKEVYRHTHGGNILADSETISWAQSTLDDRTQLSDMTLAFVNWYGITYELSREHLPKAPEEILDCFNMSANVQHADFWKEVESKVRDDIADRCDKVLDSWKDWVLTDGEGPAPDIDRAEYEGVRRVYFRHVPAL